ncbi:MAG: NADH-quinone oxidoreductase subunit N [Thermodesulfobacteriota bacterium]
MSFSTLLQNALLISPEIIVSVAGLALAVLAPILKQTPRSKRSVIFSSVAIAGFAAAFALNTGRFDGVQTAFSGSLSLDTFAGFFNSVFLINAAAVTFFALSYTREPERLGEFLALSAFCTAAMMLMTESVEFISLFVAFETMSICAYALSAFSSRAFPSAESGIKYLVTGGFSSAVMLFGIALFYGAAGSLRFDEIGAAFAASPSNPMLITGAALVLSGFIFKVGGAPLHQWIPDVYHGAPLPAAAFMSVGVKVAAFAVLARFIVQIGEFGDWAFPLILTIVAVATMTAGNIAAIAQSNVKRMLAYSSVAHVGYGFVGIVAYLAAQNTDGLSGLFYYMCAYAVMSLGAFGILSLISGDENEYQTFSDIAGLWRTKPAVAAGLAVFMFSLAGIPPTIGFFAKYRVFLPAAQEGMLWLVLVALVNSVVSAYYYLKVLVFVFMKPVSKQQTVKTVTAGIGAQAVLALLCIATLLLGVFPMYSAEMADAAAQALTLK